MREYHVIFRACDAVDSEHGWGRPFGLKKTELIQLSFSSLQRAIQPLPHQFHVVGDRLSPEVLEFFSQRSVRVTNGEFGNAKSLRETLRIALEHEDEDWIYFCEDDYIHCPESFVCIDEFLDGIAKYIGGQSGSAWWRLALGNPATGPLFISLHDERANYRVRKRRPSWVFRSAHRHWRQVTHTTNTFLTQVRWLRRYQPVLERSADLADDRYLSRHIFGGLFLHRRALCLSPVPALATHLQEQQLAVGVDWEALVHKGRELLSSTATSQT